MLTFCGRGPLILQPQGTSHHPLLKIWEPPGGFFVPTVHWTILFPKCGLYALPTLFPCIQHKFESVFFYLVYKIKCKLLNTLDS